MKFELSKKEKIIIKRIYGVILLLITLFSVSYCATIIIIDIDSSLIIYILAYLSIMGINYSLMNIILKNFNLNY